MSVKALKAFDKLLLSDGSCAIIESIEIEKLSVPETTYNFEIEDFHTYYVSENKVLVHNECWKTQKEKYWKNEAKELKGKDITYEATKGNIKLMKNGKAPIGIDGNPVELHHIQGRGVDKIVQMQRSVHRGAGTSFHATEGFKVFRDITTLSEWAGKYV